MKLIEALTIIARPPSGEASPMAVSLICGFTPLHLAQFLQAELRQAFPDRRVNLQTGLYGDLFGNLMKARERKPDVAVVLLEWTDMDARLGIRQLGGWSPQTIPEISDHVANYLTHMEIEIARLTEVTPVVLSLPTLPLPP